MKRVLEIKTRQYLLWKRYGEFNNQIPINKLELVCVIYLIGKGFLTVNKHLTLQIFK